MRNDGRKVANAKTRKETGIDYVKERLNIQTPFGKKVLKELAPFFPGDEDALREELAKLAQTVAFVKNHPEKVSEIQRDFMCLKDISYTIERSCANALSVVELFEMKSFLLYSAKLRDIHVKAADELPEEFLLEDTEDLLDELDPRHDRMDTFYIYDDFSDELRQARATKKDYEKAVRRALKARKKEISKEYGVELTPKFDIVIPKSSPKLKTAKTIPDLEVTGEDYISVTFELAKTDEAYRLSQKVEELNTEIEEIETGIREDLSKKIAAKADQLNINGKRIGRFDFVLAKAIYADQTCCTEPEITEEHVVKFRNGRQLEVENVLNKKGEKYMPVSIELEDGVTCITGANMGGKTISLKLAGLVPLMAQYGFFVPAEKATIGLSNFMQILIGDSQSVERGLSSFGSEMEELRGILDNAKERSLLLIDEIASGTNPVEGLALSKSLVKYLKPRPYISLITTHFEAVAEDREVKNMQVRGLDSVDFDKLDRELRYASRRERIGIIGKYMDYRLKEVKGNREVPKDALNIAKMLGINDEIIETAKKYISKENTEWKAN